MDKDGPSRLVYKYHSRSRGGTPPILRTGVRPTSRVETNVGPRGVLGPGNKTINHRRSSRSGPAFPNRQPTLSNILFPNVRYTKIKRWSKTNMEREGFKPTHPKRFIQNGGPQRCKEVTSTQRLDDEDRHIQSVPSCTHCTERCGSVSFHMAKRPLQMDNTTIRVCFSSQAVHSFVKTSNGTNEGEIQDHSCILHRRHLCNGHIVSIMFGTGDETHPTIDSTRFYNEHREIDTCSHSNYQILGCRYRFNPNDDDYPIRESDKSQEGDQEVHQGRESFDKDDRGSQRETIRNQRCSKDVPAGHQHIYQDGTLKFKQELGPGDDYSNGGENRTG
ncbi:hypothetical protein ACTFIZ_012361 [Dictyostelium cf. discoideum]